MMMDKFENEYHMIKYNKNTHEIALVHWAKYNLNKLGGKPIMDCISSELKKVEDLSLLKIVMEDISKEEIRKLFLKEIESRENKTKDKSKSMDNNQSHKDNQSDNNRYIDNNKTANDNKSPDSNRYTNKTKDSNKQSDINKGKMNRKKSGEAKEYEFGTYTKSKFASRVEEEDDSLYEKPSEEQLRRVKELYS